MIPPIFATAKHVVIVAGGPSLIGFDFTRLDLIPHIAINKAYRVCGRASVLWWSDHIFFLHNRSEIENHPALYKATALREHEKRADLPDSVHRYVFTEISGFDPDPHNLRHGNNSSYAALHLAAHLGARKIILLGVDMRHGPEGQTHWHEGYGRPHLQHTLDVQMRPHFDTLVKPLADRGITVLNASPESALTAWPRMTFDEALAV